MMYKKDSTEGVIVAGIGGRGDQLNQLYCPSSLHVTPDGKI